ncbi:hypothetical protein D3C84_1141280 [compost metagenome]
MVIPSGFQVVPILGFVLSQKGGCVVQIEGRVKPALDALDVACVEPVADLGNANIGVVHPQHANPGLPSFYFLASVSPL